MVLDYRYCHGEPRGYIGWSILRPAYVRRCGIDSGQGRTSRKLNICVREDTVMTVVQVIAGMAISVMILAAIYGCGVMMQPSCVDNPRNMSCMTPDQLEKELSK